MPPPPRSRLGVEALEARTLLAVTIGQEAATGFNPPDNLIANGSFERPVLERTWDTFVSDQIPGWKIISTGKIMAEVQRVGLSNWVASEGTQWLELDGDETGPGVGWNKKTKGRAEQGLYTIQQDVSSLIPGQNYWLSFDFAARPGTKLVDNHLRSSVVDADGNTLDDGGGEILASTQQLAPKKQPPRWKTATELFVAPASGQVTIQFTGLGNDNTLGMFLDNVVVVPFDADLDIDSDNDNRLGQPEKDDHEEDLETKQGKKIVVNSNDTDDDKIPDYADGFAIPRPPTGIAGKGFTPLVVKVPENVPLGMLELTLSYDAFSDPTQVGSGPEFSLPEDAGLIRIWRKNASEGRDPRSVLDVAHGDFVPSKTPIKDLTKLGFTEATREVTLYVEGVRTSEGKLVPITLDVTSNSGHFDRDLVHVVVVSNALVIGIDGTSQKEWLEGPNARRPGNPDRWNSHVRNLVEDVSPFAMTDYDFGTVDWDYGTDSPAIAARMITRAEQAIADAGGGTKIAVVGWSRGAMIAIHVASTLSNNAGRGLPRDVVFAGLYDPVNETANTPDESSPIPPSWGVVSPGVDAVVIVGARDPRREAAADVVNVDYRLTYRNDWLNDWEFRREASIDKDNRGEYTIPRIRHEGGETLVTRLFYNASHGGIGGTPGYNKLHRERPDGEYNYALDVSNSLDADRAIRAGMRDEDLDFVPNRPDAWYGFAPTRPPYLE